LDESWKLKALARHQLESALAEEPPGPPTNEERPLIVLCAPMLRQILSKALLSKKNRVCPSREEHEQHRNEANAKDGKLHRGQRRPEKSGNVVHSAA
jgi:hypothetical protein